MNQSFIEYFFGEHFAMEWKWIVDVVKMALKWFERGWGNLQFMIWTAINSFQLNAHDLDFRSINPSSSMHSRGSKWWTEINWAFRDEKSSWNWIMNYDISHFLEHKITHGTVHTGIIIFLSSTFCRIQHNNNCNNREVSSKKMRQHKLWLRNFLCQHLFCLLILVLLHSFSAQSFSWATFTSCDNARKVSVWL